MPTYVITAPDGNEYEIDAPEGASESQVLAYAQQNYKSAPAKLGDVAPRAPAPREWDYNPTGATAADGVTKQLGAFADAVQHRLVDLPLGIAQLGGNALNSAIQSVADDTEWAQGVDRRNAAQNAQVAEREAAYQDRTGDTLGSYAGSVIGQALPWLTGVGALRSADALPKLKRLGDVATLAGKAGGVAARGGLLAAEGATYGAAAPVTGEGGFWGQKGVQVGVNAAAAPLLAAGIAGAGRVASGTRDAMRYLTPGGRDAIADQRVAGLLRDEPNALAMLRQYQQTVPGEQPTVAQVLATPEAIQLERGLRNNPLAGPAFARQDMENNAARLAVVQRIAGDDAAMEAAKQTRRANADAFRATGLPETGSTLVDPASILPTLQKLAWDADPAVAKAATSTLRLLNRHAGANGGKVPATALDNIQQNVGETLRQMSANGAVTPKQVVRYDPVKTQIVDAIDGAVPGYRDYLAAYARDSAPINDMEAARQLIADGALNGVGIGGGQVLSIPQLKRTLRLDDKADFPMTDAARGELEDVLASLQRRSISDNKIAASGPGTAAEIGATLLDSPWMRALGSGGAGIFGTTALGPAGGLAAVGLAEGAQAARRDITRRVGEKVATASKARAALEAVEAAGRQRALSSGMPAYLLPWNGR